MNEVQKAIESGKFTVQNLTAAINATKPTKLVLAQMGIFKEKGITTTHCDIEYKEGKIQLVAEKERGEDGDSVDRADRQIYPLKSIHLPVLNKLMADELQGVRAFGEEYQNDDGGEHYDEVIAELHELQRQSLDLTLEMLRFGALKGKVYGKAGNLILDLFKLFELNEADAKDVLDFEAPKGVRNSVAAAVRNSKKHQNGVKATEYVALCHPTFMDKMLEDEAFKKGYERYQDGSHFRDDVRTLGFKFEGVHWVEHSEEKPDGTTFVDEGTAILIPVNNNGLFLTRFCPPPLNGLVNTKALPMYSQAEPLRLNRGIEIESMTDVINVTTSPLAVRQLSIKGVEAPAAAKAKAK